VGFGITITLNRKSRDFLFLKIQVRPFICISNAAHSHYAYASLPPELKSNFCAFQLGNRKFGNAVMLSLQFMRLIKYATQSK